MKRNLTKEEVYNIVFEYVKKYDGLLLKDIDINSDIKHFEESLEEQYQEYVKRCNLNGHEIDANLFQKKDSRKDYNFWILNRRVSNLDGDFHSSAYYVIDTTGEVEYLIDHYGQIRYPHLETKKLEIEDEWDLYDENMDLIIKDWKYGIPTYSELEKIVALPFH